MPKQPTSSVSRAILDSIFDEFSLFDKINDRRLMTKERNKTTATSPRYPNCESKILKHFTGAGTHIATTHCITDQQGNVQHWHGKDFLMYEVRLVVESESEYKN